MYVNLIDLGPEGGAVATLVVAGLLGVGFLAVMPFRTAARTRHTDAVELGMLATLITVASPYSYGYYFSWLVTPLTVLAHFGLTAATRTDRRVAWGAIIGVGVLFAASAPQVWGIGPMSVGVLFWSATASLAGLGYLMVRERTTR